MKSQEKDHKKSGAILHETLRFRSLLLFVPLVFFFLISVENSYAQSIPGTGTSAGICGNCNPTGWQDADPNLDGTPDISNRTEAGGSGTFGAGATWISSPLPLPPNGDVRWITLRDIGATANIEENVTTTMTGLIVGRTYKLVINSMTSTTNLDGGVNGNQPYAGQFIEDFDIQVGSNPRRTILLPVTARNAWNSNTIIFIASSTSETFSVFPGADSNAGNNINDVEMVHISVDSVDALLRLDTDGDGVFDDEDIDDDNDGILDVTESGGNSPNGDEDGDGIPNYQDVNDDGTGDGSTTDYTDANGDGFPDAFDFDGDGIPNHLDLDSDNDGILDNVEFQTTAGYTAPSGGVGTNGYFDIYETSADSGVAANAPENTDSSGNADFLDIDSDDDGIPDNVEAQTTLGYTTPTGNVGVNGVDSSYENVDTYSPTGITITDTDIDGTPDYRDSDSDNDGTNDIDENGEGNVLSGSDTDGDGLDNNFDADNSNYDVNDDINTPSTDLPDVDADVNSGGDVDFRDDVTGLDSDDDGIPDTVDIDDDNDGILDTEECTTTVVPAGGVVAITNSIGVPAATANQVLDGVQGGGNGARLNNTNDFILLELRTGSAEVPSGTVITITSTVNNNSAKQLTFQQSNVAGDALGNTFTINYNNGTGGDVDSFTAGSGTNVVGNYTLTANTTHILVTMGVRAGGRVNLDYLSYASFNNCDDGDTDGDGIVDRLDIDSDNDGITDNYESQSTSGYTAPLGVDNDEDGLDDAYDENLGGAANSDGINSSEWVNTDGSLTNSDTIPDFRDIDSDNDGIPDNIEAQSSTSYMAPNSIPGVNGLDSAYDFNDSFANTGLSTTLINTDGDAEPDYRDTDSDGDGTDDDAEGLTGTPSFSGTDTDGDGLDDAFENGTNNDGFVANDGNSDPAASGFIDVDVDVSTGGDLDYRDTLVGQDTDGDGIVDSVDIDDDNDGILDTLEDTCSQPNINFVTTVDAFWTLDNTTDDSLNSNNENGTSTVSYSSTAIQGIASIDFDGSTSVRYSQDGGFMESTYTAISFSAWIIPDALSGVQIIYEEGGATNGSVLWLNGNTLTYTTRAGGAGTQVDLVHPTTLTLDGQWHHVAATFNNGTLTVYLDGVPSTPLAAVYTSIPAHGDNGGIGGLVGGSTALTTNGFFSGLMDAVRYSNSQVWSNEDIALEAIPICDFDGDGIPNSLDQDSDGDGILDIIEAQTTAGYVAPTGSVGANGYYDIYETSVDSGIPLFTPENTDSASESVSLPDYLDIDSDNDGIPDNVEAQTTTGYTVPTGNVGLNGVDEAYENNDTFTATALDPTNTDTIDEPDYRDTDSDNDAILDADESGITLNGGSLGTDSDGDGLDDIYEGSDATAGEAYDVNDEIDDPVNDLLDADGDGGSTGNVDYRDDTIFIDTDGDGVGDDIDIDDDNDGILDINEDALADGDSDGIINSLDIDADDDGIPDNIEAQYTLSGTLNVGYVAPSGVGVGITDNDGDGLDDNYDSNPNDISTAASIGLVAVNTDDITGNNTDANPDYLDTDSDGDGTLDINENGNANALLGTDTDGDGYDDAFEGVLNDQDVNDDIDDPSTDLPDLDGDVNTTDGAQPDAIEYNDVDYRDIDDDRTLPSVNGNILWLRADIGVTGVGTVTNWADQSSSSLNATNTGNAPAKLGDGTTLTGLNFNPTIDFSPNQDLEITGGGVLGNATLYDNIWVYAVSASNSATNASHIFSNAVTGGNVEFEVPTTGSLFSFDTSVGTTPTAAWGGTAGAFNLWNAGSSTGTTTPSTTNKAIYRDGLLIGSNSTATGQFTSNNNSSFIGSDAGGANFFDGQIAEIMVFNTAPTSAEQQIIQSYLAIKYGITLDQTPNDGTIDEGDYVLQGGSIVWNESDNSAFHNDVAGIGRDDDKFLNQKQSRSINTSSAVTIGLTQIAENNGSNSNSFSSDGDFLMWGHNGVTVNNTNTSSVTLLCESELQLDRDWKIIETGSVGSVEIAISQATIDAALTTPTTEVIVFKVADDQNFTTNVKHIPVSTRTVNGVASYVVDYDFDGTKYFTYSEVLGIFWNGDTATWTGGAGTNGAPSNGASVDDEKVLVIDAETSGINAFLTTNVNVECLWVKENSKLVVNSDLFIEFDQDFILDGEIRLIDDAQLVQSHTGLSNVQGDGVIYRDQAATVPNTYRYHYWSSPVTVALGNTNYSTSTVMYDGTTPTSENSIAQAITWKDRTADVTTLNGETTNPITISTYWINSYFNGTSRDDWIQKFEDGAVNIAEGFIMKSTGRAPQNFTFMGSPNDGTYTKILTPGASSLLGNPYPSVINTSSFLSDNDGIIDGTLYFWEHQGETTTSSQVEGHGEFGYIGGYSQRNQAMGVAANAVVDGTAGLGEGTYNAPPQFIAVGQGFFATATAGGALSFENSQRDASTSNIFFRNSNENENLPKLKIGMDYIDNGARWNEDTGDLEYQEDFQNSPVHRQLGINFKPGNTFDYESGYDSNFFDLQPTDMYWDFENIDSNLIIAGVGAITADLQVPIGFDIESDDPVTVMIDEIENMNGYSIYLGDLVTGLLYNLENPIQLDLPKGSYTDRFVLLFGGEALSNDDIPFLDDFNVYMNNTTDQIVIRNNNNSFIKKVELFNILGQAVNVWDTIDNSNTQLQFDVFAPSAIYIVRVTTDKGEITKKVIID